MIKMKINLKSAEDIRTLYNMTFKLPCEADIGRGMTYYDAKSFLGLLALTKGEPMWLILYTDDERLGEQFKKLEVK